MSGARADVERTRLTALEQIFDCQHVRFSQIAYMDVIAYAGAIGRVVIVAENGDRISRQDGAQNQRNEVCLGIVAFAQTRSRFRAAGIEIAQPDAAKSRY